MYGLYQLSEDWGRGYGVESVFIATPEEVAKLNGKTVYFGEICGKHSEIEVEFDENTLTLMSEDQEKIEWLRGLFGDTISGHNPLVYFDEESYEEEDE